MYEIILPQIFQPFRCPNLVRLGKDNDGGYLVNSCDIEKTQQLVSFGMGEDWSLEEDFCLRQNCSLSVYDGNVNPEKFRNFQDYQNFFTDNKKHFRQNVGPGPGVVAIQDIIVDPLTFLKCDIEGNEYDILESLINLRQKLSGIIIEFHNINDHKNYNRMTNFIAKIGMPLVHAHVNNYFYYKTNNTAVPDILELTFTSSDNIVFDSALTLPHRLDHLNNPQYSDFTVTF
jgi:hypothetical protein